jgi:Bardet-Biedl syndrome 1 protein
MLSQKSQHLLSLASHERQAFVTTHKLMPLEKKTVITCMSTLRKSRQEENALTCLVIGTESKEILVLHPETFTPIDEV